MPESPVPKPARNPEPIIRRWAARIVPFLLPGAFRLVGWGAVIGLPSLLLGSKRFVRLTKKYPFTLTAGCLVLLAGGWAWNGFPAAQPAPYEYDEFDEYSGLYTEEGPFYVDAPFVTGPAIPHDQAVSVQCEIKPLPQTGITMVGFEQSEPAATPSSATPVVWLTGDIEEPPLRSPDAGRSGPRVFPRSASQHPSSRR